MEYITKQGDTWDSIAYEVLGNENYMRELLLANPKLIGHVIFDDGVTIRIPDIETEVEDVPPWKSELDDVEDGFDEFEEEDDE